ncbi:mycothiol synthase [Nakamurella deserti]|uniref:mycothiol synthase n=1 Tax=Nakamurella deserti TaxID=2164074 RepID=UPI000DBE2B95|nr:mycothiol synthase [Nakamurella deserti]
MSDLRPDLPPVDDLAALVDACVAADGVSPFGGHVLESVGLDGDLRYLTATEGGALVAVAVLPAGDPAELAVTPSHRRRGLGDRLLRAVLDTGPAVWAHGDLPAARALAARHGLRETRELVQMRRPAAAPTPRPELPDGVRIRTFVPGADDAAFLAVNARAFSWHPEQGRLDQAGLDRELAQDWFDPAGFFLAVDADDRLLGYHWTKVHPTDPTPADATAPAGPLGEIYVLGVDPESPVRGLGTPLSLAGLEYLRARGPAQVMLYVEGDNTRALRLYERLGFTRFLTDVVYAR